jgi:hypothetical protein
VSKYSGAVLDVPELASYARTERLYRSNYISGITFTTRMDAPDVFGYSKGDRCRVLVEDRFLSVDARNARILTREMNPDSNTVKLTVNLNDITLPEIDTGGSI